MDEFHELVTFVTENYPSYSYVIKPDQEIAVDGLIFRPRPAGGFYFLNENGEQEVTYSEAIDALRNDIEESA